MPRQLQREYFCIENQKELELVDSDNQQLRQQEAVSEAYIKELEDENKNFKKTIRMGDNVFLQIGRQQRSGTFSDFDFDFVNTTSESYKVKLKTLRLRAEKESFAVIRMKLMNAEADVRTAIDKLKLARADVKGKIERQHVLRKLMQEREEKDEIEASKQDQLDQLIIEEREHQESMKRRRAEIKNGIFAPNRNWIPTETTIQSPRNVPRSTGATYVPDLE